ncbi:MAG: TolC family protein, partial [Pyrinomonadaceae bacterium]
MFTKVFRLSFLLLSISIAVSSAQETQPEVRITQQPVDFAHFSKIPKTAGDEGSLVKLNGEGAKSKDDIGLETGSQNESRFTVNSSQPVLSSRSLERIGVQVTSQIPLTLEDAIKLALQNNNDIDSSRIDVRIAELNLRIARSAYDPIISSENYFESRQVPSASTIGGAGASGKFTQTDLNISFSANGFSRFGGGSYQIDVSSARTTTTNQNALLNPQFPSSFSFTYVQPLMRGFRFDVRRRNIEIAKKNLSLTDAQFRQKVIDIITQVEQAYWDLVFALKNLQVQMEGVQQARQQLESNKRLVEKGVLAPVEIVASEAQISTLEQNVYLAQESVTRAENALKTLILKDRNSNLWFSSLVPISPVEIEIPQISLETAVSEALKNRLELQGNRTQREIQDIEERYYKDLTKPQID